MDPTEFDNMTASNGDLSGEITDETSLDDLDTEPMYINIGPTHPATHGTFRVFCKLDGERVEGGGLDPGVPPGPHVAGLEPIHH